MSTTDIPSRQDQPQARHSFDLYSEITSQIMEMLEKGVVPWRSPILGQSKAGYPRNLNSGKKYRGINVFLLAFTAYMKGFGSSYWLTLKQANERGGKVRKGERSSMIMFWKPYEVQDKETGEIKEIPIARFYRVFNVSQCDGVPAPDAIAYTPTDFQPIEAAEAIVKGYEGGPVIEYGGERAFYRPSDDTIHLPEPIRFDSPENFYSTCLHEAVHSSGHSKRLDRQLDTQLSPFGSADYGKEELIAEMGAAFLCGHAGIKPAVIENQTAYISGWLGRLRQDRKLVIHAAAAGQRAADWILGNRYAEITKTADEAAETISEPAD